MTIEYEGWWYYSSSKVKDSPLITWYPFQAYDQKRLEAALEDPSIHDLTDSIVVTDQSGQRLSKVNIRTRDISPLYWDDSPMPARRCLWLRQRDEDINEGVEPVPEEWESVLEEARLDNLDWIEHGDEGSEKEQVFAKGTKVQELEGCAMVFRHAQPNVLKIYKGRTHFHLLRGYSTWYEKNKERIGPNTLPPPTTKLSITDKPPAAKQLVFVVHGIGQQFSTKLGSRFIDSYGELRDNSLRALEQLEVGRSDLIMLPISWREKLELAVEAYFPETGDRDDTIEEILSRLTIQTIPLVRNVVADVGMDVLLYMTPFFFKKIIERTLSEIKKSYQMFLKFGGQDVEKTKVSFVGHSLGAAIVSDLISFVIEEDTDEGVTKQVKGVISNLGFTVDKFFAIGAQVGLFFLLKQLKPIRCIGNIDDIAAEVKEEELERSQYPSLIGGEVRPGNRNVCFACDELYNIYHPCDPLAFRFEPLVVSATDMVTFLDPVYLPYNKAGAKYLKEKLEEGMEEAKGMLNRFTAALATCINPDRNSSPKHSSAPPQPEKQPAPTHPKFRRFNHHGRVDFSMEKDFYENEYLAALTSHFYWDDVDVACFVATELAGKPTKLTE